jgi:hypothetical protein
MNKQFFKTFKNLLIVVLLSTIVTSIYIYGVNHHKYLTQITVNPFYEASEDIGMWIYKIKEEPSYFLDSLSLHKISDIKYRKIETPKSVRRPLRYELNFYSSDSLVHHKILHHITHFLDSVNHLPQISYEERAIIRQQIIVQDSLLLTDLSEQLRWEVINYKNHKIKELENNYFLNFQFNTKAKPVNTINYSWIISFYIIPIIILWGLKTK